MRRNGFTLVELLVVIAIIGLLAGILIPVVTKIQDKAKLNKCMMGHARELSAAMNLYAAEFGEYPDKALGGAEKIALLLSCKKLGLEPEQVACPNLGDINDGGNRIMADFRTAPGGYPASDCNGYVSFISRKAGTRISASTAFPASEPMLIEADSSNHSGKFVVVFMDGHAVALEDTDSKWGTENTGTNDTANAKELDLSGCSPD